MPATHLTAQFLDYLQRERATEPGLIAAEVPFAAGRRKADLVVLDGSLVAYEVKSERDKVTKLFGQSQDYIRTFDFSYLVCEKKCTSRFKPFIPDSMGIIQHCYDQKFFVLRQAKRRLRLSKYNLSSFLWRSDIERSLMEKQVKYDRNSDIYQLRSKLIEKLTLSELRHNAIEALRSRYESRYRNFLLERGAITHPEDLAVLVSPDLQLSA